MSMPRITHCIYCNKEIKGDKSNEHVIPVWIFNHLKAKKQEINLLAISKEQIVHPERNSVPNTMTHKICGECNLGWLSALDSSCMETVKLLSGGNRPTPQSLQSLEQAEIDKLRNLIYKIFLNLVATSPFKTGKEQHYRDFHDSRAAPYNVVLFYCAVCTTAPITICHSDNWASSLGVDLRNMAPEDGMGLRFKFYLQLGHAAFVLASTANSKFAIAYDPSILAPISGFGELHPDKLSLDPPLLPTQDTIANRVLWSIEAAPCG